MPRAARQTPVRPRSRNAERNVKRGERMILVALLPLLAKAVGNCAGNSGMLGRLAAFTVRGPKGVLGGVLVVLGISIVVGGSVSEKLGVGVFTDPKSESTGADAFLDQNFGTPSNL